MGELLQYLERRKINVCKSSKDGKLLSIQFHYPLSNGNETYSRQLKVIEDNYGNVMASYKGINLFKSYVQPYQIFRVLENIVLKDYGYQWYDGVHQPIVEVYRKDKYKMKKSGYEFNLNN